MSNPRIFRRMVCMVTLLAILPSCISYQARSMDLLADGHPRPIRVTLADRSRLIFSDASIVNDTIVSSGSLSGLSGSETRDRVPLQDARLIEVRRVDVGRTALLILGVSAGVMALLGIAAAIAVSNMAWDM